MKLYISWSRTLGYFVAEELVYALSRIFGDAVRPYFSALSIERGTDWFGANQRQLAAADYAIILVSSKGIDSPWLLYEAGALLNRSNLGAELLLLDLTESELEGNPLAHFQLVDCRTPNFADVFRRIASHLTRDGLANDEELEEIVDATRVKVLLMARAEQSIVKYQESNTPARRRARDPFLYDACAALVTEGLSDDDIVDWLSKEGIPLSAYANHLCKLRADSSDGSAKPDPSLKPTRAGRLRRPPRSA